MTRARRLARALAFVPLAVAACGSPPEAEAPRPPAGALPKALAEAFREEAKGDPEVARSRYEAVLAQAADAAGDPWQLSVAEAAVDALVLRSVSALGEVGPDTALDFRTSGPPAIRGVTGGPFLPGIVARAEVTLAERRGDAAQAEDARRRSGCAREATVIGPLTWAAVTGVTEPDPLAAFDARVAPSYKSPGPFARTTPPVVVRGRGCAVDLSAAEARPGVRDVVVDVDVPSPQWVGLALRAPGTATLRAGGELVLSRPYEMGGAMSVQYARVHAKAGKLRLVARVGMDEDGEHVEIDAWNEKGGPLAMHAPAVGDAGTVAIGKGERQEVASLSALLASGLVSRPVEAGGGSTNERLAAALAALAEGTPPIAERLLEHAAQAANAPPELALAYGRAVEDARDLPLVHRAERARAAYEHVLEAWPTAWEAILAHANLAGIRRGRGEARIETLRDLDSYRAKAGGYAAPMLDVFDAVTSGRDELWGRAKAAFDRAKAAKPSAAVLADAGRSAFARVGSDRAAYACDPAPPHDRASLDCYEARRAEGDDAGAAKELERVRLLRGGPDLFLPYAMRDALARHDGATVARVLGDMLPGEVTLSALYAAREGEGDGGGSLALRGKLEAAALSARDAPVGIAPLLRATGEDPAKAYDGIALRLQAEDRAHPILPGAATAILDHRERYDVGADGVTHGILFDVRRVSGTTDVEENAQAEPPAIQGRTAMHVLRRRILKRDGRILEPERAPHASQSHADLSQLEAGDLVEAIYEAWSIPDDTGDMGVDTPDMLPERCAVHEASIELHLPKGLKTSLWSHPLLGRPTETTRGDERILSWTLKDALARRIEDGTPKMDRNVAVSFSSSDWSEVGAGLREAIASLEENDPSVAHWARTAAAAAKGPGARAKIEAVTAAAGTAVRESSNTTLTDIGLGRASGPQSETSRTILAEHEGSRTWLIVRALRELGVPAEVVIAETEPYSADPGFPVHSGRFLHPLAIAQAEDGPVWIDADVPGPPLPAGRISPELRGRSAIHADGTIAGVTAGSGGEDHDEVDLRLSLDAKGNAKGTFTVVLRGRDAPEIAEALNKLVGDERQRALRGVALAWVPFADVDDVALSSTEGSWQVAVRASLTIGGYAQIEGPPQARTWVLPGIDPLHAVYPRPATGTLAATYVSEGRREAALAVSRAVQYHAHRRVELPAGASVSRLAGPFEVKGPNLEAQRRITVSGTVIEDDFVLGVPTGTVPADAYAGFVSEAHRTDDGFLASTRVKPPAP